MSDTKFKIEDMEMFVLDLDGTFYLGDNPIEGASEFVNFARSKGKKVIFFTNNSSRSPEIYMKKISSMGVRCLREDIMTSGDVTIAYLKKNYPDASVYLVGTPALESSFAAADIGLFRAESRKMGGKRPDIVTVGFDTTLTYDKLERACTYLREGALFIATHPDINCPVPGGFIPDLGSFCACISLSTGVSPKYLGKPYAETADMVELVTGVPRDKTVYVGDRIYTDVAVGVQNGSNGILVLTGECSREDADKSEVKPTAIYESLGKMKKILEEKL